MKKILSGFMILTVSMVLSGSALAHCGMCGKDGKHGDKKECSLSTDKKQCSIKKGDKSCSAHCSKPCCSTAKTNFSPRKR